VISLIKELKYKDIVMKFDTSSFVIAAKVKHQLTEIRNGKVKDKYDWMFRV
jgi:branched-chain amino acid aminotransferase